jgi:hypothetical protein
MRKESCGNQEENGCREWQVLEFWPEPRDSCMELSNILHRKLLRSSVAYSAPETVTYTPHVSYLLTLR